LRVLNAHPPLKLKLKQNLFICSFRNLCCFTHTHISHEMACGGSSRRNIGFQKDLEKEAELVRATTLLKLHNKVEGDIPLATVDRSLKVVAKHVKSLSGWKGRMRMRRRNKLCEIIAKNMDTLVGFNDDLVFALGDITDESRGLLPGEDDDDGDEEGVDAGFLQRAFERVRREAAASALGSVQQIKKKSSVPQDLPEVPDNTPGDDDDDTPPGGGGSGGGGVNYVFRPRDTSTACGGPESRNYSYGPTDACG